mgnify:CR=1 FL=1
MTEISRPARFESAIRFFSVAGTVCAVISLLCGMGVLLLEGIQGSSPHVLVWALLALMPLSFVFLMVVLVLFMLRRRSSSADFQ